MVAACVGGGLTAYSRQCGGPWGREGRSAPGRGGMSRGAWVQVIVSFTPSAGSQWPRQWPARSRSRAHGSRLTASALPVAKTPPKMRFKIYIHAHTRNTTIQDKTRHDKHTTSTTSSTRQAQHDRHNMTGTTWHARRIQPRLRGLPVCVRMMPIVPVPPLQHAAVRRREAAGGELES